MCPQISCASRSKKPFVRFFSRRASSGFVGSFSRWCWWRRTSRGKTTEGVAAAAPKYPSLTVRFSSPSGVLLRHLEGCEQPSELVRLVGMVLVESHGHLLFQVTDEIGLQDRGTAMVHVGIRPDAAHDRIEQRLWVRQSSEYGACHLPGKLGCDVLRLAGSLEQHAPDGERRILRAGSRHLQLLDDGAPAAGRTAPRCPPASSGR